MHQKIRLAENQERTIILPILRQGTVDVQADLAGEGSKAQILGVLFGRDDQSFDINISTHHLAQNTSGYTLIKGVMAGKSFAKIRGLVKIEKNAQKSRDFLQENILLLSKDAKAETIPSLEIEANDVKASHAATIARLNEDQLFYLKSRGIKEREAKMLLVLGFFQEVLDRIEDEKERKKLESLVRREVGKII